MIPCCMYILLRFRGWIADSPLQRFWFNIKGFLVEKVVLVSAKLCTLTGTPISSIWNRCCFLSFHTKLGAFGKWCVQTFVSRNWTCRVGAQTHIHRHPHRNARTHKHRHENWNTNKYVMHIWQCHNTLLRGFVNAVRVHSRDWFKLVFSCKMLHSFFV